MWHVTAPAPAPNEARGVTNRKVVILGREADLKARNVVIVLLAAWVLPDTVFDVGLVSRAIGWDQGRIRG